jgi:hypothetical protein
MSKSTPAPPDYTAAAQATAQSSRNATNAQTVANRPNQETPFGSQSWSSDQQFDDAGYSRAMQDWQAQGARLGKNANDPDYLALRPQQNDFYSQNWTQKTELTPEAQRALDAQLGLQTGRSELGASLFPRAQEEFGDAVDWTKFDPMGGTVGGSDKYYKDANDAIYSQWADRALPQQGKDTDALRTRLYNMGLKEGDAAYDDEMRKQRENQGDAMRQAQYQATIGSGAEAQRMQGMDTSASAFSTQRRQQQIAEELQKRGFSLNEINALISGQQVAMPSMPGFNQSGKADSVDYSGAAGSQYDASLDAYNAKQAGMQGMLSGLGSLAGGVGMLGGV